MSPQEAKGTLLLYRPGTADADDPQIVEALEVARGDPELAGWFKEHCAFQEAMREKLRGIAVPPELRLRLRLGQKTIPLQVWWRKPVWLAAVAVAAAALLIGLANLWLTPRGPEQFANFQARMLGTVLREYRMDLETNDMSQVRNFLAARGAPANYDVTRGLEKLELTGAGLLRWRNHPVAMVCFNRGDNQMLFLFVMKRSALKDPPPARPQLGKMNELVTASWTKGDKTYMLAGPEEEGFAEKYL